MRSVLLVDRQRDSGKALSLARQAVNDVLAAEGVTPVELRHMIRGVDLLTDKIIGPVKKDWQGNPVIDGERDETQGTAYKADVAYKTSMALQKGLNNGGVPAKLSRRDRFMVAAVAASGSVIAAIITGIFLVMASGNGAG